MRVRADFVKIVAKSESEQGTRFHELVSLTASFRRGTGIIKLFLLQQTTGTGKREAGGGGKRGQRAITPLPQTEGADNPCLHITTPIKDALRLHSTILTRIVRHGNAARYGGVLCLRRQAKTANSRVVAVTARLFAIFAVYYPLKSKRERKVKLRQCMKGVSLIELLVVIAIISVLAAQVFWRPFCSRCSRRRARKPAKPTVLRTIGKSARLFRCMRLITTAERPRTAVLSPA